MIYRGTGRMAKERAVWQRNGPYGKGTGRMAKERAVWQRDGPYGKGTTDNNFSGIQKIYLSSI